MASTLQTQRERESRAISTSLSNQGYSATTGSVVKQSAPAVQTAPINQPPQQSVPSFKEPDYSGYNNAIEGYNNFISTLQSQLPGSLESIDKFASGQLAQNDQAIGAQTKTIGAAKEQQGIEENNASNEAKRIYSEIQQGLQARYGGTTGTGQFASEISGAQTSRNLSDIRTKGAQLMKDLDDKLLQVQEIGKLTAQDIQTKSEDDKRRAKDNLSTQIADIRSKIGETQMRKSELYQSAYENYQNRVTQIEAANTSFMQQLYSTQEAAKLQLQSALTKAKTIGSSAKPTSLKYITQTNRYTGQQTTYAVDPYTGQTVTTVGGSGQLSSESQNDSGGDIYDDEQ